MSKCSIPLCSCVASSLFFVNIAIAGQYQSPQQIHANQTPRNFPYIWISPDTDSDKAAENHPCAPGVDDRKSDLCAQWKAADAAAASANWTERTFWLNLIGIVIGLGTLAAAVVASIYARKAAMHAGNSAQASDEAVKVTREGLQAQNRAWLSVKYGFGKTAISETHQGTLGLYVNLDAVITNYGNSPAYAVHFNAEMSLIGQGHENPEMQMEKFCKQVKLRLEKSALEAVFPGQDFSTGHMLFLPMKKIEDDLGNREFKMIAPIVYGCITYRSPYIDGLRQTRFLFNVCVVDNGAAMVLMPNNKEWLQQQLHATSPQTMLID